MGFASNEFPNIPPIPMTTRILKVKKNEHKSIYTFLHTNSFYIFNIKWYFGLKDAEH